MELFIWIGIAFCISQSAMFSGLNLDYSKLPAIHQSFRYWENKYHETIPSHHGSHREHADLNCGPAKYPKGRDHGTL